jgi:hypothetical protein
MWWEAATPGLLCLNAAEHVTPVTKSLPHPSECELFAVNRDALFSYHKASELFLQVYYMRLCPVSRVAVHNNTTTCLMARVPSRNGTYYDLFYVTCPDF